MPNPTPDDYPEPSVWDALSDAPIATLLVVLFAVGGGIALLFGADGMTFQTYLTASVASTALLGLGRGLAARGTAAMTKSDKLLERFNALPWTAETGK